jgi:hypothetical protein
MAAVEHCKGVSPHLDNRTILLPGVLDDLGRATAVAGRLAVPNSDEDIAMIYHVPAHRGVGIAAQFSLGSRIAAVVLDAVRSQ